MYIYLWIWDVDVVGVKFFFDVFEENFIGWLEMFIFSYKVYGEVYRVVGKFFDENIVVGIKVYIRQAFYDFFNECFGFINVIIVINIYGEVVLVYVLSSIVLNCIVGNLFVGYDNQLVVQCNEYCMEDENIGYCVGMAVDFYKVVYFEKFENQYKYFVGEVGEVVLKCKADGKCYGVENGDKGSDFNVKYGSNVKQ